MTYQDPPLNPYDATTPDFTPETKPLDVIVKQAIESAFLKKHVWMPAKVVNVNGNQKVDIQVLLQGRYMTGEVVTRAPIQNCIVCMPIGADYSIKVPVAVGDTGIALFCDRSLDIWKVQGGLVDPEDGRNHDFSDPVFIPGIYPFSGQTQDTTTDMVFTNGKGVVRISKDGKFKITNGTKELLQILNHLLDTLINRTFTLTMLGPEKFIDSTNLELTLIMNDLQQLIEES